jgi:hypothetical protein
MTRNSKRRNPNGASGNKPSPRRGAKTKQTKVTPAKETASKVVRQTKLSFSDQVMSPASANGTVATAKAITPEARTVKIQLAHPSPPTTPERVGTTTTKPTTTNNSKKTPDDINRKNPPATAPSKDTSEDDNNKKPAAVRSPNHQQKTPPTHLAPQNPSNNTSAKDNGKKTPATDQQQKTQLKNAAETTKSTTKPTHDKDDPLDDDDGNNDNNNDDGNNSETTVTKKKTPTPNQYAPLDDENSGAKAKPKKTKKAKASKKRNDKKIPTSLQTPSETYKAIRYDGMIVLQPSEDPYQDFLKTLKAYFTIIQEVLGKDIFIASWDSEQETAFPPIKSPAKLPSSRESLGIYLGGYINPKQDGSRVYLNLRLITYKTHPVPMERFGMELAESLANSKHKMTMRRQPKPCQASRSECVGWMMYSCKSMNSETFIPALKKALKIPPDIAVGIQYRTIANEHGKKPAFDKENPPAAAIHLDIDERYALVYQAKAASLWRKNSKQRLPNGVQLRLVPCFTSATGKSMTDTQRSDAKTLLERQYYFIKEHLRILPAYFFISQLDAPLDPENTMTLRRAMMARAPKNMPTGRLIHNVDVSWNQPSKHTITSVVGRDREAQRFLVNMIPEFLHQYGEGASKWFTGAALLLYKDTKWNPEKGTTSSSKERNSEEMVKEDLWDLTDKWAKINVADTTSIRPATNTLDSPRTTAPMITNDAEHHRLASDKSVASFGNVYNRTRDADDEKEAEAQAMAAAAQATDLTGTQFEFSADQLENDRQKALNGPHSTGLSMSTAAKTTDSTRLKLKQAKEEIDILRKELTKQRLGDTPFPETEYESPETTPEVTLADSQTKQKKLKETIDKTSRDAYTERQALGAALSRNPRESIEIDSDAMEEEIVFTPIKIGSSTTDSDDTEMIDAEVINIGSSSSSSSSTDSSSESSDSSSDSESSSDSSTNSKNTQELVDSITKNTSKTEGHSGLPRDPADHQLPGSNSGSEMAHEPSLHPQGTAGDLPKAAGHGD